MSELSAMDDLLARADDIIKKKREYIRPMHQQIYYDYISYNKPKICVNHVYPLIATIPVYLLCDCMEETFVVHGHYQGEHCFASHYCHEYGFWPGPEHNPSFRAQFERKWKEAYDK